MGHGLLRGEPPYQVSTRHDDDPRFISPIEIPTAADVEDAVIRRLAMVVSGRGVVQALVVDGRGDGWVFNVTPPKAPTWTVELS